MDHIKERIKEILDVREVCDLLGIEVSPRGFILCPIHEKELGRPDTKATNCIVYEDSFYCHACGKGGDIFSLYQAVENCDFRTAKTALAQYAGIEVEGDNTPTKRYQLLLNEELKLLGFDRETMQKVFDDNRRLYADTVSKRCDELIAIYEDAIEAYKSKKSSGADELYEICEVDGVLKTDTLVQLNCIFLTKLNTVRLIKNKVAY